MYSLALITERKEQETKYCKGWHGKVILLTREKLIEIGLTSVLLKFIQIDFEINRCSYLVTSNNLFHYSSPCIYTIVCPSEKRNFLQICIRNDAISD